LVCGAFGTLAAGLFAQDQFMPGTTGDGFFFGGGLKLLLVQLAGVLGVGLFVILSSAALWGSIKLVVGLRVSAEEEIAGLDLGEHGILLYPEFQSPSEGLPVEVVGQPAVVVSSARLAAESEKS
jgi:ammonium transporter, Amt family